MKTIGFYVQMHQPYRITPYRFVDIGVDHHDWDDCSNRSCMRKVWDYCYLSKNDLLVRQIQKYEGRFKVCFSISGTALDQFEAYAPDVLESFQQLVATGQVELLNETYTHALCSLKSKNEFIDMVEKHQQKIKDLFNGYTP